ncbi:LLM class flavin-dependent oxidoreductase [Streptomyces sp. NPDC049687]|uniref:LLM class flavin-dependent oxidoreductase n=1 Tax=Streptomyces sp. NPDC049687 TaxID=3365596 RepID=UPI003791FC7E
MGLLHLAAAVDQPGVYEAGPYVELARLAERGGLDFVTLDDSSARPGLDAPAVLARVAPATHRVGLVPTLTEPSRVRAAVATLDRVSRGRAGRWIDLSTGEGDPRRFGRRNTAPPDALWQEAGEGADGAAGLRGSGPSGVPRPPQGRPVRVVDATEGPARPAAARYADVALVRVASSAQARAVRERLRAEAAAFGRDPDGLRVLVSLLVDLGAGEHAAEPGHGGGGPRQTAQGPLYRGGPVDLAELIASWHQEGTADGFHLVPLEPHRDLERLVNGTVALLQHRGLFRTFYPGSTLREHLGLARAVHQPRCPTPLSKD